MDFDNFKTLGEWDKWKGALAKAVDLGEAIGFNENTVDKMAYRIGNFLSSTVDPENREERVLQELWKVADESDKKVLAKLIVRMVEKDSRLH
ncbi:hypothetical protein OXPF_30290 [Oxobacter pfennigii]|uniref:DUF3243 domain-containing protein n=1 Tax=Oxobacter pfennigii TaxID=36849 RepID=A0A0P8WYT3_9CLOT|nr:DUF3243 domain-containing protein [Oxobacter pfennigii]KPU43588.1 hypothetical protein OXPF_30290 [Oxobacter pfennigii]